MPSTINASTSSGLVLTSDLSGNLELQSNGSTVATATSAGFNLPTNNTLNAANTFGFKNRIINGAMTLSQRNGTSAATIDGGASYTLDRYLCQDNTDGAYTVTQSSVAPAGFTNSLLVTITGTDTSLTTTQFGRIVQRIEGFNTADLGWGTANAKTVTLSFWVRSSVTGTFSGTLLNNDSNRIYAFTYTINAANTWEYKTITIAGDTTGTWTTNNTTGIELNLSIGAGPDRTVAAGAWGTSLAYAATGQTNLFATGSATFYITGVQLEVGTQATSFDFRSFGQELTLCQRYFQQVNSTMGQTIATNITTGVLNFKTTMRTQPTIASGPTFTAGSGNNGDVAVFSGTGSGTDGNTMYIFNSSANWTTGTAILLSAGFNAEL
jgi:hypothetical protein